MRRSTLLRTFLPLAALVSWSAGCGGDETGGTFVKLLFSGSVSQEAPIQKIVVNAQLGTRTATTEFQAPSKGVITLPTNSVLQINSGDGAFLVTANAFSGAGLLLGTGTGAGTVIKGQTTEVEVRFGDLVVDAGVDLLPGIDGPAPLIDATNDTGRRDAPSDRPADVPVANDGPALDVAGPADVTGSGAEAGLDVPSVGGATGTGGTGGTGGGGSIGSGGAAGGSTGTGGSPPDAGPGVYRLTVAPPSLDFGVVLPGSTSPSQSLTITNVGTVATPPLGLSISDTKSFPIKLDTCSNIVLTPGATCTASFVFYPSAPGILRAEGVIAPAGGAGVKFQLSGTGAGGPATLTLSPSAPNLGMVDVGTSTSLTFTLTNGGDTAAGTISTQLSGSTAFQIASNGCAGLPLGPRSQCVFTVTFAPTVYGPAATTVSAQSTTGLTTSASLAATGRSKVTLTIAFPGKGIGTVTGGPQGCSSPTTCTFDFLITDPATVPRLVLTATPDALSILTGWTGACTGTGTCSVTMDASRSVGAIFDPRMVTLNLTVLGLAGHTGTLVSGDGNVKCSGYCPGLSVPASTAFTLAAEPGSSSTFAAWTNGPAACKGINPKCVFPLTSTVSVVATFGPQNYMFVTSTAVIPGSLGGIAGADKTCATLAEAAKLPGMYLAWLSNSNEAAFKRVGPGGWVRTDGRPFARDLKSLSDPSYLAVLYPPRLDEKGTDLGNVRIPVATGSGPDGYPLGTHCEDYNKPAGDLYVGDASSGSAIWTSRVNQTEGCAIPQHLYCFRTDLPAALLNPPVQPGRRVFITAAPYAINGAQTPSEACLTESKAGGFESIAFLATTKTPALALVDLKGPPWKRMDGVFIVEQAVDLEKNRLIAPIDATMDGKSYSTAPVWTGAKEPVALGTDTCGDWIEPPMGRLYGLAGDSATSAAPDWFSRTNPACTSTTTHLICIER